jgi:hypothetical protein
MMKQKNCDRKLARLIESGWRGTSPMSRPQLLRSQTPNGLGHRNQQEEHSDQHLYSIDPIQLMGTGSNLSRRALNV